VHLKTVKVIPS